MGLRISFIFSPSYYWRSADLIILIRVHFGSHSLFFTKLHPAEKIDHQEDKVNFEREMIYLHRKAQRNRKEA